jgi:regulation of enolase protein 1 (concanavalin A-like superfamily)
MGKIALNGRDIGSPATAGSIMVDGNKLVVTAGGADIWGASDAFHFASHTMGGNFSLSVRIEAFDGAHLSSKAGIMLRASAEPNAANLMLFAFADTKARNKNNGGIEFQSREQRGWDTVAIYPNQPFAEDPDFPVNYPDVWLRLQRRDDVYEGFVSKDGQMWRRYCQHKVILTGTPLLGLAVTAHHASKAAKVTFSQIDYLPLE